MPRICQSIFFVKHVCPILFLLLSVIAPDYLAGQDKAGIEKSNFDKKVRAQDDLFLHVNGAWLADTDIPDDKSNFGSFIVLIDKSQERIRELIENAADSENEPGSNADKVGKFYKSFMKYRKN